VKKAQILSFGTGKELASLGYSPPPRVKMNTLKVNDIFRDSKGQHGIVTDTQDKHASAHNGSFTWAETDHAGNKTNQDVTLSEHKAAHWDGHVELLGQKVNVSKSEIEATVKKAKSALRSLRKALKK